MEDFTAGEVRARDFRTAIRGFDQDEVRAYLQQLATYLDAIQQQLHFAGISDLAAPQDLSAEYGAVGEEVTRVLEEARAAADAMRARASAEVAEWRSHARSDAEQARGDAWATGVELIDQVTATCEAMLSDAQEISLRLRAEAERDAARMVTEAQREREELARAGREEAERTVGTARKEADSLLMAARHQADVAHERTRALEERRVELMAELESTQKALLGIEDGTAPVEAEEPHQPAREESPSHWPDDDGVVRIVERPRTIAPEPVDAEALAAEVRAMRRKNELDEAPTEPEQALVSEPEPLPEAAAEEPESEPEPPSEQLEQEAAPESEYEPEPEEGTTAEPEEPHPTEPDALSGLFNSLRAPAQTIDDSPNGRGESEKGSVAVIADIQEEPAEALDVDPFALRDRLLLPVQNRALRQVKRRLVAAQNQALEELRLDPEWAPTPDLGNGDISSAIDDLLAESAAAGNAAVFELVEDAKSFEVTIGEMSDDGSFSRALLTAIGETLERSRTAGAGKRELSSSLSRVFRGWRTDDAERRLRMLSRRAYHDGLLAALAAMGCDAVRILVLDRSCVDHRDTSGPWPVASGPPAGVLVPPASLECPCTIVPDC